jgi:tRNA-specific 2-thiouridylase
MSRPAHTHTIGVAMSGGVDSTVVAGQLIAQGHSVHGFYMLLPLAGVEEQRRKVSKVAEHLDIPLHIIELGKQFTDAVITPFINAYTGGQTPNPCVICNELIKCGQLLDAVITKGMEYMATGHYARIIHKNGQFMLQRGVDPVKDQSYFLCRLQQKQLSRLILPLGSMKKQDVFQQAEAMGFSQFDGSESQDVCFLNEHPLPIFLQNRGVNISCGDIATQDGKILGRHKGIWQYTVGQRRGLGLPDSTPWYVISLDPSTNRVIVGKHDELFKRVIPLTSVHWAIPEPVRWHGSVQLRSRHRAAPATVSPAEKGGWQVLFAEPQRAITPGQYAVFYEDDRVAGAGIIQASPADEASLL